MGTCQSWEDGEEVPEGGLAGKPTEGGKSGGGAWAGLCLVGVPGRPPREGLSGGGTDPEPLPRGPAHTAHAGCAEFARRA